MVCVVADLQEGEVGEEEVDNFGPSLRDNSLALFVLLRFWALIVINGNLITLGMYDSGWSSRYPPTPAFR